MVGRPNCGKTFMMELALLVAGSDRDTGRAYSYSHISEHELGKKARHSTTPMLINDPKTAYPKEFALLVQHVSEGDPVQTMALTYTPGAGPQFSANGDFVEAWRKISEESW